MPTAIIVDSVEALADELAGRFEMLAREAIRSSGRVAVALTGGSVATQCYPRLASADVDWARVEVFFGDERAVPPDDPESNHAIADSLLLSRVPIAKEAVHRMRGEAGDLGASAAAYEADLVRVLGDPPVLDLVILGVGPDGHVCSLFPGHALLDDERWVASLDDSPKPPPGRVTLTLGALLSARAILVVASGASKAEVVAAALQDDTSELPVAIVAREADDVTFLLDRAAAARLEM